MAVIKGNIPKGEIDVKKFILDDVYIEDVCPKCGNMCSMDLGINYLSHPKMNDKDYYTVYCDKCDHDWDIPIKVNLNIQLL